MCEGNGSSETIHRPCPPHGSRRDREPARCSVRMGPAPGVWPPGGLQQADESGRTDGGRGRRGRIGDEQ